MKTLRYSLLLLCLFFLLPAQAQDTETAAWGDTGLVVDYPDDWTVDDSGEYAALILNDDNIFMYFYEPREGVDSAEESLESLIEDNADAFEFGDIDESDVFDGEALTVIFESETLTGFSTAFEFDGQILLVDSFVYDDRMSGREEETALEILFSLREGEVDDGNEPEDLSDIQLEDAFGDADDAIEELVDLGLVSEDGDILFEEEMLSSAFNTTEMPETYEGGNIAMAALVSWRPVDDDEEYRICGFVAQSSTDDMSEEEGALLVLGFDSDSSVVTFELDLEDTDNSNFEAHDADVEIREPQHILSIIQDGEVSVFVNGELAVEGWELGLTNDDDELFAGYVVDLGCVMTGVWAYSFE